MNLLENAAKLNQVSSSVSITPAPPNMSSLNDLSKVRLHRNFIVKIVSIVSVLFFDAMQTNETKINLLFMVIFVHNHSRTIDRIHVKKQ